MTSRTVPDCVVISNLTNTHTNTFNSSTLPEPLARSDTTREQTPLCTYIQIPRARSRHGKLSTATTEPTGSCESSVRGRPSARGADTRSSSSLCCCSSSPLVYDPGFGATIPLGGRSTLAGSAAIVAGGQAVSAKRAQSVGGLAVAVAEPSPREVGMSSEKGGVSRPATMKKYHLPPFLALERSGSLALAAREGPEIVQRQASATILYWVGRD